MEGVSKYFPGVTALDNVDFRVDAGEVVILVGENGAGKSTLMKVIAGVYKSDTGRMFLENEEVVFQNPAQAKNRGISIVYQEQALIPDLNAIENIFIGTEETKIFHRGIWGVLDKKSMRQKAERIIKDTFEMEMDLTSPVKYLPLVERQIIEIIRAIAHNVRILILDEPTAALEDFEREHLFRFIERIKKIGVGIIYCSHYIEECIEIGDRIVAIRDGKKAGEMLKQDASINKVIELMIGKKLNEQYPKTIVAFGEKPVLEVRDISLEKEYTGISFQLHPGEILGIGGLAGCGKSALARTLFGLHQPERGEIRINGHPMARLDVSRHISQGLAFLPSDRKTEGLFLDRNVRYNISIANLPALQKPWIKPRLEKAMAEEYIRKIRIKTPSTETSVRQLSGGNQQKAMVARWLATKPDILIFEEPTRGIDVNAKVEVYKLIGEFVSNGGAVVLVSSEVQELEGICDRVIVMHNGRITSELTGGQISKEKITYYSVTKEEMERTL
jgi:ribose transport system ATP-binding protein